MNNQLRIGNLIFNDLGYPSTICTIGKNTIEVDLGMGWSTVFYPKPIPISNHWLLSFGFEKESLSYIKNIDSFGGGKSLSFSGDYLHITDSMRSKQIPTDVIVLWNRDIKKEFYVHQLQNIYFDITGTELIRKPIEYDFTELP